MTPPGPPPLPQSAPLWRLAGATLLGALAYTATLYRFLDYHTRNSLGTDAYVAFGLAVLVGGFLATVGTGKDRQKIANSLLVGVMIAHAAVIAVDLQKDPTDHNLLPFEFVILGICATPAYVGAALSRFVKV